MQQKYYGNATLKYSRKSPFDLQITEYDLYNRKLARKVFDQLIQTPTRM